MDYKRIYNELISTRKVLNRSKKDFHIYYENHHIIPKCLGGTNDKDNLVLLTGKEHFIAHLLLMHCYTNKDKNKMAFALFILTKRKNIKINSSQYEHAKFLMSEAQKGENNNAKKKGVGLKISSALKGRKLSKEIIEKICI